MNLDLDKVQSAMKFLAQTDDGAAALDFLADSLEQFRSRIQVGLNPAEFKYVIERLAAQRSLTEQAPDLAEVSGFAQVDFQPIMFPRTSITSAPTPALRGVAVNQFVGRGFVIKTMVD